MKKFSAFLLSATMILGIYKSSIAQSLVVTGSLFLPKDPILFTYESPSWSSTDWIGIFPAGTKPGAANPSIDKKYITSSAGTIEFTTSLNPGTYDAYLLCCDGYDSISSCTFEVMDETIAFISPETLNFEAGTSLEFYYNDPDFDTGDWIAIYFDGDDPTLVPTVTWSQLISESGVVSFPGVLSGGDYFAVLFCCTTTETEYARSVPFHVAEGSTGSFIKTASSVYPEETAILVNYKDSDFSGTDWIGIYNDGEIPGSTEPIARKYAPVDSGTIEFNALSMGDYVIYLLCCDGNNIKAKYNFKVVDSNSPSLVSSSIAYPWESQLEFTYNSSTFDPKDWIGIYNAGEIPGGEGVYSIWWKYLPEAYGSMIFSYPDDYGVNTTDASLAPGEYFAGLFCCDAYGLYAMTSFIVTEFGSGVKPGIKPDHNLSLYPNPSNGFVRVKVAKGEKMQRILVFSITGQVLYQQKLNESLSEKDLELKINKGIYFVEVSTENSRMIKKLVIQ
jgi:acid phosphatase type 7